MIYFLKRSRHMNYIWIFIKKSLILPFDVNIYLKSSYNCTFPPNFKAECILYQQNMIKECISFGLTFPVFSVPLKYSCTVSRSFSMVLGAPRANPINKLVTNNFILPMNVCAVFCPYILSKSVLSR